MPRAQFVAVSLCVAALLASVVVASAAEKKGKKISLEQAWKLCAAEINKANVPADQVGARQAAGAACLAKYGYKL
jgi:hypothetical protein